MSSSERLTRIAVSAEVEEEVEEILLLLEQLSSTAQVLLILPEGLEAEFQGSKHQVKELRIRDARYADRINKVTAMTQFFSIIRRVKPDLLISGFSMLKHRAASYLFGVPHIAYLRGLLIDPTERHGISDALDSSALGRVLPKKVTQAFGADRILTVGGINRRFLVERGIDSEVISSTGPIWLQGVPEVAESEEPAGVTSRYIFLTSALAAHGRGEEHDIQTEKLAAIVEAADGRDITLRVHPRDYYEYEQDPRFAAVHLDRQKPEDFLASLSKNDLLFSPRSTFAFEAAYLGAQVVQYHLGDVENPKATLSWLHEIPLNPQILDASPMLDRERSREMLGTHQPGALRDAIEDLLGSETVELQ